MPKTTDVPHELREFNKIFESISYRHDSHNVFNDYLDFFINYFSFNHDIDLERMKNKYTLEERHKFHALIVESIKVLDKVIQKETDWYDLFGDFYQVLSSRSKASRFGQFFTPAPLCDVMVQLINLQDNTRMNEPTCGSGRLNLAAHVRNQKIFHIAQDLDYMCVRMAALNFMTHGVNGVIICMDTLSMNPESFRGAFRVNQFLRYTGIPHIEYISDVNRAFNYLINYKTLDDAVKEAEEHPQKEEIIMNQKTRQFSLF